MEPVRAFAPLYSPDDGSGVSTEEGPGASDQAGTSKPPEGGSPNEGADRVAKLEEQISQLRQEADKNIRNLQSTYDRQGMEYKSQIGALESTLRKEQMKDMDTDQRAEFERTFLNDELSKMKSELNQSRQELDQMKAAQEWADRAIQAGVSPSNIDRSSAQAMVNSIWNGMETRLSDLNRQIQEGASPAKGAIDRSEESPQKKEETPPDVVTGTGSGPSGARSMDSIIKSLNDRKVGGRSDWNLDKVYTAFERRYLPQETMNEIIRARAESMAQAET